MVSEALSCILNFTKFLGEAPHTRPTRGGLTPSRTLPPRVFDAWAHATGMSNFPNSKGTGTFPIWSIKSLAFILQPGVYNVHLPIMLKSEPQAVYRERKIYTAYIDRFIV